MKFDNFDYNTQGGVARSDIFNLSRRKVVFEISTPIGKIENRTGLPTQFRTSSIHPYELQSACGDATGPERYGGFRPVGWTLSVIFRTPDNDTPDQVLAVIGGGENLVQMLPDGGIARWIVWPTVQTIFNSKEESAWIGLWRIEYPDGKIERFLPEIYSDPNQLYAKYLADENGKDGVSELQSDGSYLLKDGGGATYARVVGSRFIPLSKLISSTKYGPGVQRENPLIFNSPEVSKLVKLSRISKKSVLSLRPSEVVGLYYSTGHFVQQLDNSFYYSSYEIGLVPELSGKMEQQFAFMLEATLKQRLYQLRPDVRYVKLSDGNSAVGIFDPSLMPPLDGTICRTKPSSHWTKYLVMGLSAITGLVGGMGAVFAALVEGVKNYSDLKQKQKQMSEMMKQAEAGQKVLELSQSAQAGAMEIITKDPPSRADIEQEARAAGQPVPTSTAAAAGGGGVLILALAAAAILA